MPAGSLGRRGGAPGLLFVGQFRVLTCGLRSAAAGVIGDHVQHASQSQHQSCFVHLEQRRVVRRRLAGILIRWRDAHQGKQPGRLLREKGESPVAITGGPSRTRSGPTTRAKLGTIRAVRSGLFTVIG